jgi:VCBS repeat-containing protein
VGSDTHVLFDADGSVGGNTATTVAVLQNVTADSLVAENFNPAFSLAGAINHQPLGEIQISGDAFVGRTLEALSTLIDVDGIGEINYSWFADGELFAEGSSATVQLTERELGKSITVVAHYIDGLGNSESVDSAATLPVEFGNRAPTGDVLIAGLVEQGQTLTVTHTLEDLDGLGEVSYQWQVDGVDLEGETADSLVLTQDHVGKSVRVLATYTDDFSTTETVSSTTTDPVANVNDAATGEVLIAGLVEQGQTLTVTNTLEDLDGLGEVSYQWQVDGVDLEGETSDTLVLTQDHVGKSVRVLATYTDGFSTIETVSSTTTDPVANINDAPVLVNELPNFSFIDTANSDVFAAAQGHVDAFDIDGDTLTFGISGGELSDGLWTQAGLYGTLTLDSVTGSYRYTPLNSAIESLKIDSAEIFYLYASDGEFISETSLQIDITGADDTTSFSGTMAGSVLEDTTLVATGLLLVGDRDEGDTTIETQTDTVGTYGVFNIDADGAWTYQLDNSSITVQALNSGQNVLDIFRVYTGSGLFQSITVTVSGKNELKIINGTSGNDNLKGTSVNEVIYGFEGNDTLNGGAGADEMWGHAGNDLYYVDNINDFVYEEVDLLDANDSGGSDTVSSTISYSLGRYVENLTLTGSVALNGWGNDLSNKITGNTGNNILTANEGDDTISGGAGADTMWGGSGNDSYVVDNTGDIIREEVSNIDSRDAGGIDSVTSSVTYSLTPHVENLTLTGSLAISGIGNDLDNQLTGNNGSNVLSGQSGNDTLNGGSGSDTMRGGAGDDIYIVDNSRDVTNEAISTSNSADAGGIDTVRSSVSFTLGAYIENLALTGTSAINGTGNSLNNLLTGNNAINTLNGGVGNDIMNGGGGNDKLTGGTGSDYFDFSSTPNATSNVDTITDFNLADDTIRFDHTVFSGLGNSLGVLSSDAFASGAGMVAAADSLDRIIYNTTTGDLYYDADGIGGDSAIKIALIGTTSHPLLTHADFMLI